MAVRFRIGQVGWWRLAVLRVAIGLCTCAGCSTSEDRAAAPAEPESIHSFHWDFGKSVRHLSLAPRNRHLVAIVPTDKETQKEVVVVSVPEREQVLRVVAFHAFNACFSPNGELLAVICSDGLHVYDIQRAEYHTHLKSAAGLAGRGALALAFTADSQIVCLGDEELRPGRRWAWNIATGEERPFPDKKIVWHGRLVSPDGTMVACERGVVYRADTGQSITYIETGIKRFTADSENIVKIQGDGVLFVREIRKAGARTLGTAAGYDKAVTFDLSEDGVTIAVGDEDGSVWLGQLPTF